MHEGVNGCCFLVDITIWKKIGCYILVAEFSQGCYGPL
jgi:hypothetical protein